MLTPSRSAVPITTSKTESRIKGYIAAGDIELSPAEVQEIDKAGRKVSSRQAIRRALMRAAKGGAMVWAGYLVCRWAVAGLA